MYVCAIGRERREGGSRKWYISLLSIVASQSYYTAHVDVLLYNYCICVFDPTHCKLQVLMLYIL